MAGVLAWQNRDVGGVHCCLLPLRPDGLLGVSNNPCYPCSSWSFPSTGDVSVFVGSVGNIYPWNTVGAEFQSLRVTSSVRVACPNAFIPNRDVKSTVPGTGWVSLPRPSDGTASEVAESCRSICESYLDSLADPSLLFLLRLTAHFRLFSL